MSSPTRFERLLVAGAALLLVAGLLRSGAGLAYYYAIMLQTPFVLSPTATTDELVKSVGLPAADALVTGVAIAGWSPEDDVVVVAAVSAVSAQEAVQFHYVASYLLYPRRIWLIRWCDSAASGVECSAESDRAVVAATNDIGDALLTRRARNLIVLGGEAPPLHPARSLTLTPVVHLLQL
jgi:hypothetical protein